MMFDESTDATCTVVSETADAFDNDVSDETKNVESFIMQRKYELSIQQIKFYKKFFF